MSMKSALSIEENRAHPIDKPGAVTRADRGNRNRDQSPKFDI